MPRLRIPRPFAAITFATVVACTTTPTDVCACLRARPHTVVYGRVTDAAGAAVQGAIVRVETGAATCQALEVQADVQANAAGEYRAFVDALATPGDLCVRLVARDQAPSGVRYSAPQQFTTAMPTGFPADSVRRDIVIPAS